MSLRSASGRRSNPVDKWQHNEITTPRRSRAAGRGDPVILLPSTRLR
ncbi:hypothetical protein KKF25_02740 [Patescibacteria group bacterium]|nr:hypothetical protein [Patescibacteria group bacterium]